MTIRSTPDEQSPESNDHLNDDNNMSLSGEQQAKVRKRIDELLEAKRLKDLLDDSEDW